VNLVPLPCETHYAGQVAVTYLRHCGFILTSWLIYARLPAQFTIRTATLVHVGSRTEYSRGNDDIRCGPRGVAAAVGPPPHRPGRACCSEIPRPSAYPYCFEELSSLLASRLRGAKGWRAKRNAVPHQIVNSSLRLWLRLSELVNGGAQTDSRAIQSSTIRRVDESYVVGLGKGASVNPTLLIGENSRFQSSHESHQRLWRLQVRDLTPAAGPPIR
jgi:hypothetical protein